MSFFSEGESAGRESGLKDEEARRPEFLVELTGPHVLIRAGADQLARDAHGVARAPYAAFQPLGDVGPLGDGERARAAGFSPSPDTPSTKCAPPPASDGCWGGSSG